MAKENKKEKKVENYFNDLNKIKCDDVKKGQFSYLSWSDAWTEVKKRYPDSQIKVYEHPETFMPYFCNAQHGAMVKVGVIIKKIEHIVWLPLMDYRNKSIQVDKISTMDVNKAIQRATAKAIAFHGLSLYLYRGEDFPKESDGNHNLKPSFDGVKVDNKDKEDLPMKEVSVTKPVFKCEDCKVDIPLDVHTWSSVNKGKSLCRDCQKKY